VVDGVDRSRSTQHGVLWLVAAAAVAVLTSTYVVSLLWERQTFTGLYPDVIAAECGPVITESVFGVQPCRGWVRELWWNVLLTGVIGAAMAAHLYRAAVRRMPELRPIANETIERLARASVVSFLLYVFLH
jgi:uncharacterized membrane protein YeaQ/YmgE (transglycosylase-associated protein family)